MVPRVSPFAVKAYSSGRRTMRAPVGAISVLQIEMDPDTRGVNRIRAVVAGKQVVLDGLSGGVFVDGRDVTAADRGQP